MSMRCSECGGVVYQAETRIYDGKTFHGLCFLKWKRQYEYDRNQERHAEYYKIADACPTKIRVSNYNTIIYATQYNPIGTQPNNATITRSTSSSPVNFKRRTTGGAPLHSTYTL